MKLLLVVIGAMVMVGGMVLYVLPAEEKWLLPIPLTKATLTFADGRKCQWYEQDGVVASEIDCWMPNHR